MAMDFRHASCACEGCADYILVCESTPMRWTRQLFTATARHQSQRVGLKAAEPRLFLGLPQHVRLDRMAVGNGCSGVALAAILHDDLSPWRCLRLAVSHAPGGK